MGTYEQKILAKDIDGSNNYVTSFVLGSSFEDITTDETARYYIDCANWDEMTIYFTVDPASSGDIVTTRIDFSPDQTTWCAEADEVVTAGAAAVLPKTRAFTTTAAGSHTIPVASIPLNDRWARIMVKDDVGTTGTLGCKIILSKVGS
tara:strand:+ start:348 stop:791 length:444 start_codon:yes stop_codon:yes gene_type:complete